MRLEQPHRTRAPETGCVKTPWTYTNASVQGSGKESGSPRGPKNETPKPSAVGYPFEGRFISTQDAARIEIIRALQYTKGQPTVLTWLCSSPRRP